MHGRMWDLSNMSVTKLIRTELRVCQARPISGFSYWICGNLLDGRQIFPRHALTLVVLSPIWLFLLAQIPVAGQVRPGENDTIKIETSLVWVPVSVKTRNGSVVLGLSKDRFKIFENGVEQEIAHFETPGTPLTVALLIDASDSAKLSLSEMRAAATAFLDKLLPQDKALIVSFDRLVFRVIGATEDRDMLKLGIMGIKPGGGTSLYDAVDHVANFSFQGVSGRKAVILLTDGIDTASAKATFESSANRIAEGNNAVFPIQFQPDDIVGKRLSSENSHMGAPIYTTPSGESITEAYQRGTRYLRLLANSSGGRFQFADSLSKLDAAFTQIAAELRQQYFIGFYPDKTAVKRETRKLRVTVDVLGARVNGRESYVAKP